ncbi:hypothetical protein T02_6531 [Trichinella nativa]|uniref:Uncharacterized protein n=1 Tax=Trichinella nativa TaxID=6335 RepID=A0A0V1LSY3_9BILA|nr:hypothetical protein T06_11306 [Trichinella sp. T6]KRZ62617.1 hypothetical protein T02_6531 [Trichinella nativa]
MLCFFFEQTQSSSFEQTCIPRQTDAIAEFFMGNGGNQVYDKAINTIPAWSEQNLQNDGSTPPAALAYIFKPRLGDNG